MSIQRDSGEISTIFDDLTLLEEGKIREVINKPGVAKCATIAKRIRENIEQLIEDLEIEEEHEKREVDKDQFNLLSGLLDALYDEFSTLSKKQPDAFVNVFKTTQVNRVLIPLKDLLAEEPSTAFLDLLCEPDDEVKTPRAHSTYSDSVIIMSQYREACNKYRFKCNKLNWNI